jgi:hypothetical protein
MDEKCVTYGKSSSKLAEMFGSNEFTFFGLERKNTSRSKKSFERKFVNALDALVLAAEVAGRIHMGAAVGIEVQGTSIPPIAVQVLGDLPRDARGFRGESRGKVDEHDVSNR